MITKRRRTARINVRLLIICLVVVGLIGIGGAVGYKVRKQILAERALEQAKIELANENWPEACKHLRQYLSKYPDDIEMLSRYGQACLAIRPLEPDTIGRAMSAYRRILRKDPGHDEAYRQLVKIYSGIRNFSELAHVSRMRLAEVPDDVNASVRLAEAQIALRSPDEARRTLQAVIDKLAGSQQKDPLFVEACRLMAEIASSRGGAGGIADGLAWLDRAVEYDPSSAEALVTRARYRRVRAEQLGEDRATTIAAAKADLERAGKLDIADPRIRLVMSEEWAAHGNLKRAQAQIDAVANLDEATIDTYFLDPDNWVIGHFLQAGELAIRQAEAQKGMALADKALDELTLKRQRIVVLPTAIRLYVNAGRVELARQYLDEYLEALRLVQSIPESPEKIAALRAVVARGEGKPYRVIEILEPFATRAESGATAWRLLAEAFSETGQRRRATRALQEYLRLRPSDREAAKQLVRAYIRQRDWSRALALATQTKTSDPTDLAAALLQIEVSAHLAVSDAAAPEKKTLEPLAKKLDKLSESHPKRADLKLLQAMVAVTRDRKQEAEKHLTSAVEECEETLDARLFLSQLYVSEGKTKQAVQVLETACKDYAESITPWLALADLYAASKQHDKVREVLQRGLEAVSEPQAKREFETRLALNTLLHGDRKAGIAELRKLADRYEADTQVRSLLLGLPEVRKDQAASEKLIEELRQIEGKTGLLWRYHRAAMLLTDSDWKAKQEEIIELLDRCLDADPGWDRAALLLGEVYERLAAPRRAEQVYRRLLAANPSAVNVADRLLALLGRQRRFDEAKEVLAQLQVAPTSLAGHRLRTAIGAGDLAGAMDQLELKIAADPKDAESRVLLARLVYQKSKDLKQALTYLDEAEKIDADLLSATAARVAILSAEGRQAEALKVLNQRIAKQKSFEALFLRAMLLARMGKQEAAEQDYKALTAFPEKGADGYVLLGLYYSQTGRLDEAIKTWRKGAAAHPKSTALKRSLARGLLARNGENDRKQAREVLDAWQKIAADDPDLLLTRSLLLLSRPDPESAAKARDLLERVVQLDPTSIEAHLALIRLTAAQKGYDAARDLAIRALAANPNSTALLIAQAEAEAQLGNLDMARELARMALSEDPENAAARRVLVDAALTDRDAAALREARGFVEAALAQSPNNDRLKTAKAVLLSASGDKQAAIAELQAVLKSDAGKDSIAARLGLANIYLTQGQTDLAGKQIDAAAAVAPDDLAVARATIDLLGRQGDYEGVYKKAATYPASKPADAQVMIKAAQTVAAGGTPDHRNMAIKLLERAVEVAPGLVGPRVALGGLAYMNGQVDRAEEVFRELVDRHPTNADALNNLAWVLAEARQDYAKALELADKATKLAPDNVHMHDTRGVILRAMPDRLEAAREEFRRCVDLSKPKTPERARALFRLGLISAKLNDLAAARQHVDKALRIDPSRQSINEPERQEVEAILNAKASASQ